MPESTTIQQVRELICAAVASFLQSDDLKLLQMDVNERTITFRLASHLQQKLASSELPWRDAHVDCEYNRDVSAACVPYTKRLELPLKHNISNEDTEARTVFPDIAIHRRGKTFNHLVVEVKKGSASDSEKRFDREVKLPQYLKQLKYENTAFLVFGTGADDAGRVLELLIRNQGGEALQCDTTDWDCLTV